MADYKSGLPIRSESDGTDEKVVVKVIDGTPGGSNQMSVDADKNAHVEMHGNDPAGTDRVVILSEEGRIVPRGDYDVTNNTKPGSVAVIAHARNTTPGETHQTFRPTGVNGTALDTVHALDIALHDESGNAFTVDNPLPVTITDAEGVEINAYSTSSALAVSATANHEYTVTSAKRLKLSQVWAAASGRMKVVVQVETEALAGTFDTKFVAFNSTANPNIQIPINELITVDEDVIVRIAITNLDNQSQDVYSTISGHEID